MDHFKVVIIGSGPAGATTAFYLAQAGVSTAILEKEQLPRYKTCGGGFVYRGRKNLPFDIGSVVEREFYNVHLCLGAKMHFNTQRNLPTITMIMRDAFDNLIVEKAKEYGVTLLENNKLLALDFKENDILLTTNQKQLTANYIIAADGALGITAKLAGWTKDTRSLIPALEYEVEVPKNDFNRLAKEVRFDIDVAPNGYAWSFPKKNHLSIGVLSTKRTKVNLKKYYKEYLQTLGISKIIKEELHGFQIPVAPRTDGFVKNNVFLIGDAAGFADPITAEGISNAILSGKLAAESLIESKLDKEKATKFYKEKIEQTLIPELKTGVWLAKFFYEQKTLRNLVLQKYGQHFSEYMADIFMGDKAYPHNVKKKLTQKIKELVF